jgi:hypothetical protein
MSNTGSFFPRLGNLKMRKIALLLAICVLGFGAYGVLRIVSTATGPVSIF